MAVSSMSGVVTAVGMFGGTTAGGTFIGEAMHYAAYTSRPHGRRHGLSSASLTGFGGRYLGAWAPSGLGQ